MKQRTAFMPVLSMPGNTSLLAKNILVLFDQVAEPNHIIKRIAIINEKALKALIIDNLSQIGVLDVLGNQDGANGTLWYPKLREIGLFRKLSVEKLIESGTVTDPVVVNAVSKICQSEKYNDNGTITFVEVLLIAKNYIENYPSINLQTNEGNA